MTAIAVTHVAFEDAGLIGAALAERGVALRICPAWDIPAAAAQASLLILLGGPISANDVDDYPFLAREIALARDRIAAGLPTLGVCLGAQIMARAIGGSVGPGPAKEIGWAPLDLTAAGRASALAAFDGVPVLHWHGEVCAPPPGVASLAATPACAVQAFDRWPSDLVERDAAKPPATERQPPIGGPPPTPAPSDPRYCLVASPQGRDGPHALPDEQWRPE